MKRLALTSAVAAVALATSSGAFGGVAVLGVAHNDDLPALRAAYGFSVLRAIPSLRAAEIRVGSTSPARDSRVRYLSRVTTAHHTLSVFTDPLLVQIDPTTERPYEWQFAAANVGPALEISAGSASVVVGTIDSGAADIPDLAGKVDSRWTVSAKGKVTLAKGAIDDIGHGTAVASLIAANGFGMEGFGGATHVVSVRVPK